MVKSIVWCLLVLLPLIANASFNHSLWDTVLKKYVHLNDNVEDIPVSTFDYLSCSSDSDFNNYLTSIENANVSSITEHHDWFSFWINTYNALAVKLIIDNACDKDIFGTCGPIASIRNIGSLVPYIPVWDMFAGTVGGTQYTLDDIENLLRTQANSSDDFRLHFAIVGASLSYSNLRNEAFVAESLDEQLTDNFNQFISNTEKGMSVDQSKGNVELSSIFTWFSSDFTKYESSVVQFILKFLSQNNTNYQYLSQNKDSVQISYIDFNWDLNAFRTNGHASLPCDSSSRPCYQLWALLVTIVVAIVITVGAIITYFVVKKYRNKRAGYERIGNDDDGEAPLDGRAKYRDLIAFFIFGLLNNYGYVVMLSAAVDLMGDELPTAVVLVADILPSLLVQGAAPFFMQQIPYAPRVIFCVICSVLSFLVPAYFETPGLKLIGVVLASISCGFGEITFLALTSKYHKNTVSAWSSGTGGAGLAGAGSYVVLRLIFDAKTTLYACSPLALLMLVSYFVLLSKPVPKEDEHRTLINQKQTISIEENIKPRSLTMKEKLALIPKLLPYMIPLAAVYFSEYLINQGISPLLHFSDDLFGLDCTAQVGLQYRIYQLVYQGGVFVSRSSVNFFPIKRLWAPAVAQVVNLVFLFFVGIYDFVPAIWFIFAIIFWEGLCGGSIYVNAFWRISEDFTDPVEKEFCLGGTSVSYSSSISIAGFAGIGFELLVKYIRHNRGLMCPA